MMSGSADSDEHKPGYKTAEEEKQLNSVEFEVRQNQSMNNTSIGNSVNASLGPRSAGVSEIFIKEKKKIIFEREPSKGIVTDEKYFFTEPQSLKLVEQVKMDTIRQSPKVKTTDAKPEKNFVLKQRSEEIKQNKFLRIVAKDTLQQLNSSTTNSAVSPLQNPGTLVRKTFDHSQFSNVSDAESSLRRKNYGLELNLKKRRMENAKLQKQIVQQQKQHKKYQNFFEKHSDMLI